MSRILFPILLVVLGVMAIVASLGKSRDDSAFRTRGQTTTIESIDNITEHEVKARRSNKVTHRYQKADVTFKTNAGERVTALENVLPANVTSTLRARQPVTIWYLPDRPTTIRFEPVPLQASSPLGTRLVGLLLIALGVVMGVRALRSR